MVRLNLPFILLYYKEMREIFQKVENEDVHDLHFYKFVLRNLPVATITVNSELVITSFNPMAVKIIGCSESEAVGSKCCEILRGKMCKEKCPIKEVIHYKKPIFQKETVLHNKEGGNIPVSINANGLFDDQGNLMGGLLAFQDISYLKTLEREKTNFASMLAHDMKSPLISIQGFLNRIIKKMDSMDKEKQRDYLKIVRREADKLEFLVNDFLEFSRLQTGNLKLNFTSSSLDKELRELFDSYMPKVLKTGITLRLQNTKKMPMVEFDANRLRRVFTNLLDNAFKFSRENVTITIQTEETDQDIMVKIIDQGTGIDPNDLPHIFNPFHRGKGSEKKEGYGIGLSTAKAIMEGHGGKILVESEPGKGSTFTVVLPKKRKERGKMLYTPLFFP